MADTNDFNFDFALDDIFGENNTTPDMSNVDDLFGAMATEEKEEVKSEEKENEPEQKDTAETPKNEEPSEDRQGVSEAPITESAEKAETEQPVKQDVSNTEESVAEKETSEDKDTKESRKEPEEETIDDIVVETPAPKKKGRRKKARKESAETPNQNSTSVTELNSGELEEACKVGKVDESFVGTLCYSLGEKYDEQKKRAQDMMNDIVITSDMDSANIRIMNAKNMEFSHFIEKASDQYIEAYKNLSEKGGLIERIKLLSEASCDGSAADKKVASILALTNYVNPKTGQKVDLLVMQAALRAARDFWENMRNYSKSVGIALNLANKTSM